MVQKPLAYSPALLKIFDEILVNAADNKQRDPDMNELRVDVDRWVARLYHSYVPVML